MIQQLFTLLERLVVALETIAAGGGANTASADPAITNSKPREEVDSSGNMERDYDYMAGQKGGRDALLILCEKRGIEVPPRTKTDTLVKKLNSWDLANPEGSEPKTQEDPLNEDTLGGNSEPDFDPFAADEEEKTYTADDIKVAFQKHMAEHYADDQTAGYKFAAQIFADHGGAAKLPDVDPSKYGAIMKALAEAAQ